MKNYEVYEDSKYLGKLKLTNNEKLYLFDDERKPVRYENDIIALRGSIDIDVIPFEQHSISVNNKVVSQILSENKIKHSNQNITANLVKKDLDNNGSLEEIYTITNAFVADENSNTFSIIAVLENNKISYLRNNVREGEYTLKMCVPKIQNIIDIDKDKKYEIISSCTYYSNIGTCHNLHNSDYKMIKDC